MRAAINQLFRASVGSIGFNGFNYLKSGGCYRRYHRYISSKLRHRRNPHEVE